MDGGVVRAGALVLLRPLALRGMETAAGPAADRRRDDGGGAGAEARPRPAAGARTPGKFASFPHFPYVRAITRRLERLQAVSHMGF